MEGVHICHTGYLLWVDDNDVFQIANMTFE